MKVYIGQTRSRKLIEELSSYGFGECTTREEFPPRRLPWFLDNGAFKDWKANREFKGAVFKSVLRRLQCSGLVQPDFIVCPDIVAGGTDSLRFSLEWKSELEVSFSGHRWYLAVQDGMSPGTVESALVSFAGLFVGGTLSWKLANARTFVEAAHYHNKPCHVGRVGTRPRAQWASSIAADSIDSCLPLWSKENLSRFLEMRHLFHSESPYLSDR